MDINNFIDIPGFPNYRIKVSTNEVRRKDKLVNQKIFKHKYGHLSVSIQAEGRMATVKCIHQLVMLIKEGPCPPGHIVCHNDGDPENNHPDNLRYGTHSENTKEAYQHRGGAIQSKRRITLKIHKTRRRWKQIMLNTF